MLFVPNGANSFGLIQSSVGTTRINAAQGTSVTPAVGSKGAWAQVIASLTDEVYGLLININSNFGSAASRNSVIDIGVGAAASELVLIPNLIAGNAITYNAGGGLWYYFPVSIPAGTRIAVRAQGSVATAFRVYVQAMQRPLQPAMMKRVAFVEAIGMTLPQGTAVTSGTTNKGSGTLLGTTTLDCWFWQLGVQVSSADTSHNAVGYHIDLAEGNGTNYNILMQDVPFLTTTSEAAVNLPWSVSCETPRPAGRSIYARAQGSGTTDPLFITAYGAGG